MGVSGTTRSTINMSFLPVRTAIIRGSSFSLRLKRHWSACATSSRRPARAAS